MNSLPWQHNDLTGLILAGGQGSRMGGQDKGLVEVNGIAMVAIALRKFKSITQHVIISANRHLKRYAEFGVTVVQDDVPNYSGPLAGILSGLKACETTYLGVLPCDSPAISIKYLDQLHEALENSNAEIAYLVRSDANSQIYREPLFALLKNKSPHRLEKSLEDHLRDGQCKVLSWYQKHQYVEVQYDHQDELRNINDPNELHSYLATLLK